MKFTTGIGLITSAALAVRAHGDHESPPPKEGETIQAYAQRHVRFLHELIDHCS